MNPSFVFENAPIFYALGAIIIAIIILRRIWRTRRKKAVNYIRKCVGRFCATSSCEASLERYDKCCSFISIYVVGPYEIGLSNFENLHRLAIRSLEKRLFEVRPIQQDIKMDIIRLEKEKNLLLPTEEHTVKKAQITAMTQHLEAHGEKVARLEAELKTLRARCLPRGRKAEEQSPAMA